MEKILRSLILEEFPLDLRVEINLLSKNRNLINKEKHDKILEILRKYDIDDVVKLGPGTNRYAIRYKGYAVKIATDSDGLIDNAKEFLMAPKLQPYVTKAYEISEDWCFLICEYIQPFQSYPEMLQYADKIKHILDRLSSVYLLGDVGIVPKNSSNWGLRFGSDEPVCLDFAYVFEVSSSIFLCNSCKQHSMLIPTKDFSALICQNPACGKKYDFAEIRMRISQEQHMKEIGDLGDVGYRLSESNTSVELDPVRSPYLLSNKHKKKKKKIEENQEELIEPDNFVIDGEEPVINAVTIEDD